jgi:hypothetical protein
LVIYLTDGRDFKVDIPTVSPGVVTTLTEKVNKIETQVQELDLALENSSKELAILKEIAITKISVDPENSVNSISINNETGYLEVNSLSVNKLVQEEGETLVLDCSQTF